MGPVMGPRGEDYRTPSTIPRTIHGYVLGPVHVLTVRTCYTCFVLSAQAPATVVVSDC